MSESNTPTPETASGGNGSSTGLDENLAGLLTYLLGFITGIVFLVIEKKSRYVRFHAFQSTILWIGFFVLNIAANWIPVVGGLVTLVLGPASLILWILLMVKAYQGERFKLPIVGDMAEERAAADA